MGSTIAGHGYNQGTFIWDLQLQDMGITKVRSIYYIRPTAHGHSLTIYFYFLLCILTTSLRQTKSLLTLTS